MKLYEVTNGYMGDNYLFVLIVAENEEQAYKLASNEFKCNARIYDYDKKVKTYDEYGWDKSNLEEFNYPDKYWTNLEVNCLCDDVSKGYVSDVWE